MTNEDKFDGFFGEKVERDFKDEIINFTTEENESLKEGVKLSCLKSRHSIEVGEVISLIGGQGVIYKSNYSDKAIKIYREEYRTKYNEMKLMVMIEKDFSSCGICWPTDILYYKNSINLKLLFVY